MSEKISRRNFLKLAGTAAMATLLASCAPATTAEPTTAPVAEEPTVAPETETEPTTAPSQESVELIYVYAGNAQNDLALVQDALSQMATSKINATVKLNQLDWAAFDEKAKLMSASGEKFDLIFTAAWINNYYQNISKGALVPLTDLLKTNAPNFYASMPETTWEAAKVGGEIYGAINQQIFVKPWGAYIRTDMIDKYQLDFDACNKYEDLEPFLQAVKDGEGINPIYSNDSAQSSIWKSEYYGYDPILETGNMTIVGVKYDDAEMKGVLTSDTDKFMEACTLANKWYEAGYYPEEPLPAADAVAAYKAGKYAVSLHLYKPGGESESKAQLGYDVKSKSFMENPILTTAGITATMNGISATSTDPVRTAQLLELMNTDVEFYNTLCKGIEGKHWVWVDESRKIIGMPEGVTAETSGYNPNTDWMFGCQFNAYYVSEQQAVDDVWAKTRELNDNATPSVTLGFAFVTDPVKNEIAQVTAIAQEYYLQLGIGMVDPTTVIPEYNEKVKAAGVEKIIEEVQTQIAAWVAAKA